MKHIDVAQKFVGLDEHDDAEEIINKILKPAGINIDPSETPWCAAFVNGILFMCGLPTLNTLRARDFAEYGEEGSDEPGAIVVFKSHVGFVPEPGKCLGGNQSDGINIGEQLWYGKPIAYRKPPRQTETDTSSDGDIKIQLVELNNNLIRLTQAIKEYTPNV